MTDTAAARAYPPEPEGEPAARIETIPPAAHTHALGGSREPTVSASSTAVLDSVPPLGFPGEPAGISLAFGGEAGDAEPPPFGFNAPERTAPPGEAVDDASLDEPAPAEPEPAAAASPGGSRPSSIPTPMWPRQDRPSLVSRRDLAPRDLMPSAAPSPHRRQLGDAPTPTFGPPGKERLPGAMVALSVLTLGFYAVAWHRRVNQEMGDFDPRIHVHPARSAWAVALPLLAGLLATAGAAARIILDHAGIQLDVPVTVGQAWIALAAIAAVPYLVMLLPFSMVAVTMTAERVRVVEDHAGVTTDEQLRPAALVGWLLFPVIGGFVVMARQQQRLNGIWRLARS